MGLVQKYPHRDHIVKGITQLICRYEDNTVKFLPSILTYIFTKLQEAAEDRIRSKELMYSLIAIMKTLLEVVPDNQTYINIIVGFTRHAFPFIIDTIRNPRHVQNDEDP